MAISIAITDGTDTVTLTATDALLEAFVQQTPGIDDASVTETIDVELFGGNAAVDANIAELERLFTRARERVNGAYGVDWVYIKITLDSAVWRSPILDGRIVIGGDTWLKYERALGVRKANILITREPWWEADTEVQIALTNGNGTNNTAGLKVYDCNDQSGTSPNKKDNTVTISGLAGDLPAPLRIELALDGSTNLLDLMISQDVNSGFNFNPMYEGDISAGSTTTTAGYSNGNYQSKTAASVIVSQDINAIADKLKGGYYRILAKIYLEDNIPWKIKPLVSIGVQTFYAKSTTLTSHNFAITPASGDFIWWDMGVIQLPPIYMPGLTWNKVVFGWVATASSAHPFLLDCFQLTPLDGWKRIVMDGPVGATGTIYINELLGQYYALVGGKLSGYGITTGETLNVHPSVSQTFRLVWNANDNPEAFIGAYLVAKMFYRPRRRTL